MRYTNGRVYFTLLYLNVGSRSNIKTRCFATFLVCFEVDIHENCITAKTFTGMKRDSLLGNWIVNNYT